MKTKIRTTDFEDYTEFKKSVLKETFVLKVMVKVLFFFCEICEICG